MPTTSDPKTKPTDAGLERGEPLVQPGRLQVPDKTWYKDAGLRSLYKWMPILMLGIDPSTAARASDDNSSGHELISVI